MKIAENFKIWIMISLAVILIGFGFIAVRGLNFGIDFTGGTLIEINMGREFEASEVRDAIASFDLEPEVIHSGADKTQATIKTKVSLTHDERTEIFSALSEEFGLAQDDFLQASQFGPTIGSEIRSKALLAVLYASVGMLLYIWWRFHISYGVSSIVALIHDVLVLVSVYAVFNLPINSSFVAAVLTIVGYSINDTIVVFDRIRENVRIMKNADYKTIANTSLRQTIARSINTSLTTLLVIGTLYIFGTDTIKEFALPLMAGVLVGTYSSIFIASPLWAFIKKNYGNKAV